MKEIKLFIEDYGYSGEGVAKHDGKTFFVPKTITSEHIQAEVVKEHPSFSFCKLNKVITPSPLRQKAPCPYYDKCGGCNFQHISLEEEKAIKKTMLLRQLAKVCETKEVEIVESDKEYGYRNKIRLKVKEFSLGFYEKKTNNFIKIEKCLLAGDEINSIIPKINKFLKESKTEAEEVAIYDFDGRLLLDFIGKPELTFKDLENHFNCPTMLNQKGASIKCNYMGITFNFKGDAFRQVNDFVANKLYDEVISEVEGETIVNAFSGIGVLSGLLAKKAKKVYGIELNHYAHEGAEELRRENNLLNMKNICGYVEKELLKLKEHIDSIILDPPRAGCDKKVLSHIVQNKISKIVYVSCNPATLARDLKLLQEAYDIKKIKLFDMFPRTANIETLVVLALK